MKTFTSFNRKQKFIYDRMKCLCATKTFYVDEDDDDDNKTMSIKVEFYWIPLRFANGTEIFYVVESFSLFFILSHCNVSKKCHSRIFAASLEREKLISICINSFQYIDMCVCGRKNDDKAENEWGMDGRGERVGIFKSWLSKRKHQNRAILYRLPAAAAVVCNPKESDFDTRKMWCYKHRQQQQNGNQEWINWMENLQSGGIFFCGRGNERASNDYYDGMALHDMRERKEAKLRVMCSKQLSITELLWCELLKGAVLCELIEKCFF
jgi:hypothetical protein